MNHNEFVQTLKAGKVSGAYLFEGVEENIKSVTLAALRKAVLADGLAELNESVMENPSAGEIIAACETLPFASDKRLVVVRELNGTTGRSEAEERLVSYIPSLSRRISRGSHSGSPKRTLYSKTFGPSLVIIRPA